MSTETADAFERVSRELADTAATFVAIREWAKADPYRRASIDPASRDDTVTVDIFYEADGPTLSRFQIQGRGPTLADAWAEAMRGFKRMVGEGST